MPYIGNEVGNRFVASKAASVYSGDGSTTAFTLEHAVGSDEDILVSVDGVVQEPSVAYAVSSGTTLTFTAAPSSNSGNNIFVYYLFRTVATVDHPATSALTATSGTFTGAFTSLGIDDNADATAITINNSEQVGIGTTSHAGNTKLHVSGTAQKLARFERTGSATSHIEFHDSTTTNQSSLGSVGDNLTFETAFTERMRIDSTGAVTKPFQPAFLVNPSSDQSNIAINTNVTVVFGTERFDNNSDFASNTFTAPVTGKYQMNVLIYYQNVDSAASFLQFKLVTSNVTYQCIFDPDFGQDAGYWCMQLSQLVDMDASDTASVVVVQSGGSAQTDIATPSYFSGYLVA